jgi:hypothetical protein
MKSSRRTSHRQPSRAAAIQNNENLANLAVEAIAKQQKLAYNRGVSDALNGTRDHPPYGFSDLKAAWRRGWLASQKGQK